MAAVEAQEAPQERGGPSPKQVTLQGGALCSEPNPQEVPAPKGLPPGWTALKRQHVTGERAGQTYIRFYSPDGVHKHVPSVRMAVRKDAEDRGLDPEKELQKLEKARTGNEGCAELTAFFRKGDGGASPRTPPQRPAEARACADAAAVVTPSPVPAASLKQTVLRAQGAGAAAGKPGAGPARAEEAGAAGAAANDAGGDGGSFGCPGCGAPLAWSDYCGGGYQECGGWECDDASCGSEASNTGAFRWFCGGCSKDFCRGCAERLPPPRCRGSAAAAAPARRGKAPARGASKGKAGHARGAPDNDESGAGGGGGSGTSAGAQASTPSAASGSRKAKRAAEGAEDNDGGGASAGGASSSRKEKEASKEQSGSPGDAEEPGGGASGSRKAKEAAGSKAKPASAKSSDAGGAKANAAGKSGVGSREAAASGASKSSAQVAAAGKDAGVAEEATPRGSGSRKAKETADSTASKGKLGSAAAGKEETRAGVAEEAAPPPTSSSSRKAKETADSTASKGKPSKGKQESSAPPQGAATQSGGASSSRKAKETAESTASKGKPGSAATGKEEARAGVAEEATPQGSSSRKAKEVADSTASKGKPSKGKQESSAPPQDAATQSGGASSTSSSKKAKAPAGGGGSKGKAGGAKGTASAENHGGGDGRDDVIELEGTSVAGAVSSGARKFLVDNSFLNAKTQGLGYRVRKRMQDKAARNLCAKWGTCVLGVDEGDGWLSSGGLYLPMRVGGVSVVTPLQEPARTRKRKKTADPGVPAPEAEPAEGEPEVKRHTLAQAFARAQASAPAPGEALPEPAVVPAPQPQPAAATPEAGSKSPVAKRILKKRPAVRANAFIVFCAHARREINSERRGMGPNDLLKEIAQRWRALGAAEKAGWAKEAQLQKAARLAGSAAPPAKAPAPLKGRPGFRFAKLVARRSSVGGAARAAAAAAATAEAAAPAEGAPAKRRRLKIISAGGAAAAAAEPAETPAAAAAARGGGAADGSEEAPASQSGEAPAECPIEEDAPPGSGAHYAVRCDVTSGACHFEYMREGGERVRFQTTFLAAGGCREAAMRIARLCYVEFEAGAEKEAVLLLRGELYKRCGPAKKGAGTKETFRNLLGEVVVVTSLGQGAPKTTLKAWSELESSDIDLLSGDDINVYERELKLSTKRTLPERISRLEQMAQRTTLPLWGAGPAPAEAAGTDAGDPLEAIQRLLARLDDGEARAADFDAKFLQAFLALPAEQRRHASVAEITRLERVAHIADGGCFSIGERRARLKDKLWESRSSGASAAPKQSASFFKTWLSKGASSSDLASPTTPSAPYAPLEPPAPEAAVEAQASAESPPPAPAAEEGIEAPAGAIAESDVPAAEEETEAQTAAAAGTDAPAAEEETEAQATALVGTEAPAAEEEIEAQASAPTGSDGLAAMEEIEAAAPPA